MLNSILSGGGMTLAQMTLCTAASVILGLGCAIIYMYKNTYTKSFVLTLAVIPPIVQVIIMLVNGNIGAGVAVAGAFSLVRFRSAPGSAREISGIFLAMGIGLACGMGYIGAAAILFFVVGLLIIAICSTSFGEAKDNFKTLKVTIPEDLDYTGIFDDLFEKYTLSHELVKVKTTNMGSLYELNYTIDLRRDIWEKEFLDSVRCRNGNLTVVCAKTARSKEEL